MKLLLLFATSALLAFSAPIAKHPMHNTSEQLSFNPSELCPIVKKLDSNYCNNSRTDKYDIDPSQLCPLL